ncbi:hypothetical protein G9464_19425 [Halostella sp. JP-L12]|uniref:hypothetical protein n=1 Tax=Halostella TaxID=1843185 RepID=UPI000EF7A98B|nr:MULTISPECIES: hypothetical protein [Halostella]NHN49744.1 hypothetical protein [Halostella sp. JP-L12]
MLDSDHDRRGRSPESDDAATDRPSDAEEATDEELSDAIAGIELDDPHTALDHGVVPPDAPSEGTFDLDGGRAAEADDAESRDERSGVLGPLRALLSRVF